MKNKKNIILIAFFVLLILLNLFYLFIYKKNLYETIEKYERKIESYKLKIEKIENEQNTQYLCEYTQTFRYIEDYDFIGTVPNIRFIVVDKYQEYIPRILNFNVDDISVDLEKGKYYEIKFIETKKGSNNFIKNIESITPTDNEAFDQIQEICEFN